MDAGFVHHVYFWLKDQGDLDKLIVGLDKLSKIQEIKFFHIGVPAGTSRGVIDSTYSVSWLCLFESGKEEEVYQQHPIHLDFVSTCQDLWSKVVVYDSVNRQK